ncbi:MAG: glycosyltransferase family 4 protein [Bacteroidia bacterium]|nr:glycosyltransferase family 4 protein [Bacteroidia bacterium]
MRSERKKLRSDASSSTIVHLSAAKGWRGGEQQIAYLLSELEQRSIQQVLVCIKDSILEQFCKDEDITHYSFTPGIIPSISFARCIYRISKSTESPIFHSHDSHSHTACYLAYLLFGVKSPLVVSRRVDFQIGQNFFSAKKYNAKNIAKIICVSNAIKEIISADIKAKEKLITIHSGVNLEKFNTNSFTTNFKRSLNLPEDHILIGNTSAISDHKDYFTFVRTAKEVVKKHKNVHFVIIGDGPLRAEIEKFISSLDLNEYITLCGFRNDIKDILPQVNIFLFPSKTEGLGTSVLDAFAAKVPVVSTETGGIPEMIENGKTGLSCTVCDHNCLANAVERLITDPTLRQTIVNNALLRLEDFDKSQTAEKTLAVYRELELDHFER